MQLNIFCIGRNVGLFVHPSDPIWIELHSDLFGKDAVALT